MASISRNKRVGYNTGPLGIVLENGPLGGGFRGFMPDPIEKQDRSDNFARERFMLREAWNTNPVSGIPNKKAMQTPFRVANNAGDLFLRQNYSCGGTGCQSFQSRPNMHGLKQRFGSVQGNCDSTGVLPASGCNQHYVYDSSDYTTYLKQKAINKLYNDKSGGGDDYNASQCAQRAIRRF